ncbi:hypothetical protein ACLB1T_14265 [Escherichia coli]
MKSIKFSLAWQILFAMVLGILLREATCTTIATAATGWSSICSLRRVISSSI